MAAVYGSVLDMIGNTPLVDVSPLSPNPRVRILAKMESQNPFGSVKDRIALAMIEAAEKDGSLARRDDLPDHVDGLIFQGGEVALTGHDDCLAYETDVC